MKRFIPIVLLALLCGFSPAMQTVLFSKKPTVASTYQGPGDIVSGAFVWYSCARAYNAAWAAAGNKACKVVDTATGLASCDIVFTASGFADMTTPYCTGSVSVTTFCTVSHAACSVTTAYDQSGNGRDAVQATLANMPGFIVSDGSLAKPVIDCTGGTNSSLQTASSFTFSNPTALEVVYNRTSGTAGGGAFGGAAGWQIGAAATANNAAINGTSGGIASTTAPDASWNILQGLANGSSPASVLKVNNGSDITGTATISNTTQIRLCRAIATQLTGRVAEGGAWQSALTSTDRSNVYTNAHGTNGYNGGV